MAFNKSNLNPSELAVFNFIESANRVVTQQNIADAVPNLGRNEKHESDLKIPKNESTLRQVRYIIRSLRLNHHAPILSNDNGFWICKSKEDGNKYLENLERSAKASAKAYMITFHSMKSTLENDYTSDYFEEQQGTLFD